MLNIGTIYRTAKNDQGNSPFVDGLPNFFYETKTDGFGFFFQRGIHSVRKVTGPDGIERCPLIIISSTPRKAGSEDTPWMDRYDPDHGYVNYFGDNKYYANRESQPRPETAPGNKNLLDLFPIYKSESREERLNHAVPCIFMERLTVDGRAKGNAKFQGFGLVESIELVTQYDKNHNYFSNYKFGFCVLSLAQDGENFDWDWIRDRCDSTKTCNETLQNAPESWKKWIDKGNNILHQVRRSISEREIVSKDDQLPIGKDLLLLKEIYNYYTENQNKHDFEYLAMEVTVKSIEETGAKCIPGWITKKSSDGGVDFVLRVDIGNGMLSSVNIVVLGQAKCEKIDSPTNGKDIARTVARMKRGWIGAYVTTSFFSTLVQKEVKEDSYPLMLINGSKIVSIVKNELFENQMNLDEYLLSLKTKYKIKMNIPEDVLYI